MRLQSLGSILRKSCGVVPAVVVGDILRDVEASLAIRKLLCTELELALGHLRARFPSFRIVYFGFGLGCPFAALGTSETGSTAVDTVLDNLVAVFGCVGIDCG